MQHTPSSTSRQIVAALLFVVVLALMQGCANLGAIREFANISSESAQYTKLVTDYVESPTRQKPYQPANQYDLLIVSRRSVQSSKIACSSDRA